MKKTFTKLFSVLLALTMLFALTACNNTETEDEKIIEEETVEVTEEPVITPEPTEEPEPEPEGLSESDLLPFIQFYNLYVTQRDEAIVYPTEDEDVEEGMEEVTDEIASEDGTEAEDSTDGENTSESDSEGTKETEDEVYDPLGYLLTPVVYDDTVILSVAFDGTAVDVTVPGDYDLTFTVTVDREAYDAALLALEASSEASDELVAVGAEDAVDEGDVTAENSVDAETDVAEAEGLEEATNETTSEDGTEASTEASGEASSEIVTEEVIIVKTVHIVTTEDYAAALADGTIIETAEGTAIVVVEDEVDEVVIEEDSDEEDGEDAEDNGDSDDDSQDNDTTNSTDDKSDSDNTSTNNDSDTSNVTSPTTTSAPATSTGSGTSTSSGSTSSGSTSSGSTSSGSTSSGSTSSGSTSGGSTSSGSTSSGSTSSGSTSSGTSSSGSTSSGTSSSTATATPAPTATAHVHTWVTETVEDGYYEQVVTGYKYDYDNATYVEGYYMCRACGYIAYDGNDITNHCADEGSSYTRIASHWEGLVEEPVYETVWVDTSYTIVYCSECGSTQ